MICTGRLDTELFFIDPLSPIPHHIDVKVLSRLAIMYDLPLANSHIIEGTKIPRCICVIPLNRACPLAA